MGLAVMGNGICLCLKVGAVLDFKLRLKSDTVLNYFFKKVRQLFEFSFL